MGARHPQAVLAQLNANKNEFILAARHLIKQGLVASPGDAIRYMEEHNTDVKQLMEQVIISKQTKIVTETEEDEETVDTHENKE